MKHFLIIITLLLILTVAIIVGAQNDQLIAVNYLIARSELKLSILMAIMLVIGMLISGFIFLLVWLRLRWRIRRLQGRQPAANQ